MRFGKICQADNREHTYYLTIYKIVEEAYRLCRKHGDDLLNGGQQV